jgi:hypothetical protein
MIDERRSNFTHVTLNERTRIEPKIVHTNYSSRVSINIRLNKLSWGFMPEAAIIS